eukprot:Clim_evm37s211 gene=Clim_evmTU37s211
MSKYVSLAFSNKYFRRAVIGGTVAYGASYFAYWRIERSNLRQAYKAHASILGHEPMKDSLGSTRRLTVIVNPKAGKSNARDYFDAEVAPVFHMAGIDFGVVEVDHVGHGKTLASSVDTTKTDGIVVVGNDGLVQEVVTGLLRREDRDQAAQLPVGVIPVGKANGTATYLYGKLDPWAPDSLGRIALGIAQGKTRKVDALEITPESTEALKSTEDDDLAASSSKSSNDSGDSEELEGPEKHESEVETEEIPASYALGGLGFGLVSVCISEVQKRKWFKKRADDIGFIRGVLKYSSVANGFRARIKYVDAATGEQVDSEVIFSNLFAVKGSALNAKYRILEAPSGTAAERDGLMRLFRVDPFASKMSILSAAYEMRKEDRSMQSILDHDRNGSNRPKYSEALAREVRIEPIDPIMSGDEVPYIVDGEIFPVCAITAKVMHEAITTFAVNEQLLRMSREEIKESARALLTQETEDSIAELAA